MRDYPVKLSGLSHLKCKTRWRQYQPRAICCLPITLGPLHHFISNLDGLQLYILHLRVLCLLHNEPSASKTVVCCSFSP